MAEEFITVEVEGEDKINFLLERAEQRLHSRIRGVLEGMGSHAVYWLRIYMHVQSGYTLRHTDHTSARWRPGGAGGAGEWEVVSGVKRGTSRHPLYANQGTGLYVGRGLIRPSRSKVLTFQKRGEPRRFKRYVRGQEANPFLYLAFQQVRLYANARIHTLGSELFR
jgi:hypothetical protein